MEDLKFHILENKTDVEFIISDHPVLLYNWFHHNSQHPLISSPLAIGAQLFLPISKTIYLCLYDHKIYNYRIQQYSNITKIISTTDVNWLNELQARSAQYLIGFSSGQMKQYIASLKQNNMQKTFEPYIDSNQTLILVGQRINKMNFKPSFFQVKKKLKLDSNQFGYRDPEKYYQLNRKIKL